VPHGYGRLFGTVKGAGALQILIRVSPSRLLRFESILIQFGIHTDTDLPIRSFSCSRMRSKSRDSKEIL
jgi:hypothetical protein